MITQAQPNYTEHTGNSNKLSENITELAMWTPLHHLTDMLAASKTTDREFQR